MLGHGLAVGARLLLGDEAVAGQNRRRHDEACGLDVAQPLEVRIARGHA
jgi:hypothetical protein